MCPTTMVVIRARIYGGESDRSAAVNFFDPSKGSRSMLMRISMWLGAATLASCVVRTAPQPYYQQSPPQPNAQKDPQHLPSQPPGPPPAETYQPPPADYQPPPPAQPPDPPPA